MTRQQKQWIARMRDLSRHHARNTWALGDEYNDGRQAFGPGWCRTFTDGPDWKGVGYSSLKTYASVCRRFPPGYRYLDCEFGVYQEIAVLPTLQQRMELLTIAEAEGWKQNRTRIEVRLYKRGRPSNGTDMVSDLQVCIDRGDRFRVILADPPWDWETHPGMRGGTTGHYKTLPTEEIKALRVPQIATSDAMLFMWSPAAGFPDALTVMAAWGFKYKTHAVGIKPSPGTGYYWRMAHEDLLLGVRDATQRHFDDGTLLSVFEHNRTIHSKKPAIHADLERAYGGPYIELYGREEVKGWTVYGNQLVSQLAAD